MYVKNGMKVVLFGCVLFEPIVLRSKGAMTGLLLFPYVLNYFAGFRCVERRVVHAFIPGDGRHLLAQSISTQPARQSFNKAMKHDVRVVASRKYAEPDLFNPINMKAHKSKEKPTLAEIHMRMDHTQYTH